jgi:hypothetical protein
MKQLIISICICAFSGMLHAQNGGSLMGVITDSTNNEPIPIAIVKVTGGTINTGAIADMNGAYSIKGIPAGEYKVEISHLSYQKTTINNVVISNGSITFLNQQLGNTSLKPIEIVWDQEKEDLLGKGTPPTMTRITAEELLENANPRGVIGSIVTSVPKAFQTNERAGINFSGSRTDATQYYIDGIKVIGEPQIPQSGIEEMVVITGGVPAQYGDTTSGVVLITTKTFR